MTHFSFIIVTSDFNKLFFECLKSLLEQNYDQNLYEILIISEHHFDFDKNLNNLNFYKSKSKNPSTKRNIGVKNSKGRYLIFLDDDAYANPDYLNKLEHFIKQYPENLVFFGPGLLPKNSSIIQKFIYTNLISYAYGSPDRYITSTKYYKCSEGHSLNLICNSSVFDEVSFDENYWPGEDTKFFFDLFSKSISIFYVGYLYVFHHPRNSLKGFFKQVFRYGYIRSKIYFIGLFIEKKKIMYCLPSVFVIYLLCLLFINFINISILKILLLIPLSIYVIFIVINVIFLIFKKNNFIFSLCTIFIMPIVHISYGLGFIKGFINNRISIKYGR